MAMNGLTSGNGGAGGFGGTAGVIPSGGIGGTGGMLISDASIAGAGGVGGAGGMPMLDAGATLDSGIVPQLDAGSSDAAIDAGQSDDDRCDVAVLDPARPPRALDVTGDLGTHDPAVIAQDGTFYVWQTGPRLPGKTSTDLIHWSGAPSAFGANPAWISSEVPGASDLWAPDLSYFGGTYHLYYSASTFGSNHSCIGHATRDALDEGSWQDHGSVICSGNGDDHNTIDPNVIVDTDGTPWLAFGSFWSGIKIARLKDDGSRADDELHAIASRGGDAIEAPFIVRRCGYYYLFVSFDRCCDGAASTYNIRVGRAAGVLGPYVDRDGTPLLDGGGTQIVSGGDRWRGPGHSAVIFSEFRAYNVFHAYDASDNGRPKLRVAELAWDDQGWPVSGGP